MAQLRERARNGDFGEGAKKMNRSSIQRREKEAQEQASQPVQSLSGGTPGPGGNSILQSGRHQRAHEAEAQRAGNADDIESSLESMQIEPKFSETSPPAFTGPLRGKDPAFGEAGPSTYGGSSNIKREKSVFDLKDSRLDMATSSEGKSGSESDPAKSKEKGKKTHARQSSSSGESASKAQPAPKRPNPKAADKPKPEASSSSKQRHEGSSDSDKAGGAGPSTKEKGKGPAQDNKNKASSKRDKKPKPPK